MILRELAQMEIRDRYDRLKERGANIYTLRIMSNDFSSLFVTSPITI